MALIIPDRVSQKVAGTGTGNVALSATAQTGFRTLAGAGVADGNTVCYTIEDGAAWECGLATFNAASNTISRQVFISSAANLALNLTPNAVFSATVISQLLFNLPGVAKSADVLNAAPSVIVNCTTSASPTLADKGKMFVLGGTGNFILSSAVRAAGWYCFIRKNDNTNSSWSISPADNFLIDGLATISCYQEDFIIFYDGSAWRTFHRQRGWIDIGLINIASVTSLLLTQGFTDTELQDHAFDISALTLSASDQIIARVQKNASVYSTGYATQFMGSSGTTVSSNSTYTTCISPCYASATSFTGAVLEIQNPKNPNGSSRLSFESYSSAGYGKAQGNQFAIYPTTGVQLLALNASTLVSGMVVQRAFRR